MASVESDVDSCDEIYYAELIPPRGKNDGEFVEEEVLILIIRVYCVFNIATTHRPMQKEFRPSIFAPGFQNDFYHQVQESGTNYPLRRAP